MKHQILYDALRGLNESSTLPSLTAIHYMREIKHQTIPDTVANALSDIYVKREK